MNAPLSPEFAVLLKIARERVTAQDQAEKTGFVDPAMASGAPPGGAPPAGGMDPMAGAMPPMPAMGADPAAMGGDPAAMGGAPMGPDPAAGLTEERVMQMIQQATGGGAGAGGAGASGKMKVDVNTEIYHVKKMLALLLENLGIEVPPSMLLGDPADDPQSTPEQVASDPASAGASPQSAIGPIQALQGASPALAAGGGGGGEAAPKAAADRVAPDGSRGLLGVAGEAAARRRVLQAANG